MADLNGLVDLNYIVSSYILRKQEDTKKYEIYLQYVVNGISALNLSIVPESKVTHLVVAENNTIELPIDYMNYILIGIKIDNRIYTLTRDDRMSIPVDMECGEYVRDNDGIESSVDDVSYSFSPHVYNGDSYNGIRSMGVGFNAGSFRVDLGKRKIFILTNQSFKDCKVILEYKSSGVSSKTLVLRDCVSYLMDFIDYEDKRFRPNLNEAEYARKKLLKSKRSLYSRRNSLTPDEFLDAINSLTYKFNNNKSNSNI